MKKNAFLFFIICLGDFAFCGLKAQSSIMTYSPSSATLIGDASRIGYHVLDHFTFYMRYSDSSYFCHQLDIALFSSTPNSHKVCLPQNFVITDFRSVMSNQLFIGSYQGVGMYGWINVNDITIPPSTSNTFFIFKLPAVERLKRVSTIVATMPTSYWAKIFAIGEGFVSDATQNNYIMEFCGLSGDFTPYAYAPMPLNSATGEKEIADDVATFDHYVIFATRDTRKNHAPINFRISDTSNVLSNTAIDNQWQFWLSGKDTVVSELRLLPLPEKYVVLTYIKYNTQVNKYYLCVHRITFADFLANNNAIVSHEIELGGNCLNMVDVIYDSDVETMVILLNGNGTSELYHVDPLVNTNYSASELVYSDGQFYSIDTLGDYYQTMPNCYAAMGDSVVFCQDISNGIFIEESCLGGKKMHYMLVNAPHIQRVYDPLVHFFDNKDYDPFLHLPFESFEGIRTCIVPVKESE